MRDGQPGVVRDLRVDIESVVLRLAPVGAVDSFDLSVSWHGETHRVLHIEEPQISQRWPSHGMSFGSLDSPAHCDSRSPLAI